MALWYSNTRIHISALLLYVLFEFEVCSCCCGPSLLVEHHYLPLVSREWKNGSNSCYNCTPFLHSLLTKGHDFRRHRHDITLGPCRLPEALLLSSRHVFGGSWVVICGVISRETFLIAPIGGIIALLITTYEPPSSEGPKARNPSIPYLLHFF